MKKGIIVLLIAVLASSFAFASLSGDAGIVYEATFGDSAFEFDTTNKKALDFSFTFTSDSIELDSSEDEIHVEVAASAKFILGEYQGGANGDDVSTTALLSDRGIGIVASIDTAKIVGKNWYVDITGTKSAYDYAKAPVLTIHSKDVKDDFGNAYDKDDQAASYVSDYVKVPGVTVGINGFTVSGGIDIYNDATYGLKGHLGSATIETPEFAFNDDAIKVQAAAQFSHFAIGVEKLGSKAFASAFGASAKATATIQDITVGVAADMGVDYLGDEDETETQFNVDARVNFKYNFVDASIYTYAGKQGLEFGESQGKILGVDIYDTYEDFYLEAKAAFDLNTFEIPLTVTVSAKNITNSEALIWEEPYVGKAGIDPAVEVKYAKDAITAAASFDINTRTKAWNALAYGTYAFEKFTAGAGVYVKGATELTNVGFGAFADSDKLVKGATFGLSYGLNAGKVYSKGGAVAIADATQYTADFKADPIDGGNVVAYCKIAF